MEEVKTTPLTDAEIQGIKDEAYKLGHRAGYEKGLLLASDELNSIINRAWIDHEKALRTWATSLGRPLFSAIPDRQIQPETP